MVTRGELLDRHNANAAKIPSLWAVADVEIALADGSRYRLTQGRLLLRKRPEDPFGPQDFMLRGKEIGREFFRMGVDAAGGMYYFWINATEEVRLARWGKLADLHRPGHESLQVDPTQLLGVLGVLPWPWQADEPWRVVHKAMADPCVDVLMFVAPRPAAAGGGLYVQREIWLDRNAETRRPMKVWLYDPWGRCVMAADLSDYRRIETSAEKADWPVMPSDIRITLPAAAGEAGKGDAVRITSIRLRLSGQTVESEEQPIPPAAFRWSERRLPPEIRDARPLGPIGPGLREGE